MVRLRVSKVEIWDFVREFIIGFNIIGFRFCFYGKWEK